MKRKIISICLISIAIVGVVLVLNNEAVMSTEEKVSQINDEYFEISIDLDTKTVTADSESFNITDFFNISDEYLEEMLNNNSFEEFLSENLIGDIEIDEETINISNPYSTKALIIEASTEKILEEYNNIESYKEIVEGIYLVRFSTAIDTKQGYEELQIDEDVQEVMTDYKIYMTSNDINGQSVSSSNISWGVSSTGLEHYSSKLNYEDNDEEIIIAVLDTGIYSSHEAFSIEETADKIDFTYSYDYINSDSDPSDDNGHGTKVAGVIAETTSNNVKIAPVKILDADGTGNLTDLMEAIDNIYEYVDIINLSLGVEASSLTDSDERILEAFFKKIYDYGTIVVCAAGNESTDVYYPACSEYTLATSAVDSSGKIASFSNYGDEIDFALPGVSLYLPSYTGENEYSSSSGTSFSSPFLAAAIALIKADYNYTSIDDIMTVLKENAEDLGDEGKDVYFGYGRIDFDLSMFATPIIANIEVKETTWAKENTIIVDSISSSNIEYYSLTTTDSEPSEWNSITNNSTDVELEISTTNNGTNYVWIKDQKNNVVYESINIEYVDNTSPELISFTNTSVSDTDINVQITVQDYESGISEIKWYYKKSSDSTYTEISESCTNNGIGVESINKTHEFTELEENTEYQIYSIVFDFVGNNIQTETLEVITLSSEINVSVQNMTLSQATISIGTEERTDDFETTITEGVFYVTCEEPCSIITTSDESSYSRMTGEQSTENTYKFSFDIHDDIKIIIALKGDVNLNGTVNAADVILINRSCLSNTNSAYNELSSIGSLIADVNGNGEVNAADAVLIRRSSLSTMSSEYLKLSW